MLLSTALVLWALTVLSFLEQLPVDARATGMHTEGSNYPMREEVWTSNDIKGATTSGEDQSSRKHLRLTNRRVQHSFRRRLMAGEDQPGLQCPYPNGFFHHPLDCHKYIICLNNHLREEECSDVDANYEVPLCTPLAIPCKSSRSMPLTRRVRKVEQTWECPAEDRLYAISGDCTGYLRCVNKKMEIESCPDNQTFNELQGQCITGPNPDCQ